MLGHKRVRTENLVIGGVEVELALWEREVLSAAPTQFSWAWRATLGEHTWGQACGLTMPHDRKQQAEATEKVRQKVEDYARKEVSDFWKYKVDDLARQGPGITGPNSYDIIHTMPEARGGDANGQGAPPKGTVRVAIRCDQCGGQGRLPPREALQGPLCGMCQDGLRIVDGILLDEPSQDGKAFAPGELVRKCEDGMRDAFGPMMSQKPGPDSETPE